MNLAEKIWSRSFLSTAESRKETAAANGGADQFAGLPIESLICKPIVAAARGRQELTVVYIDGIKKLAYKDGKSGDTNIEVL